MAKREVSFSDLSGQMGDEGPDGLVPLVVTDYPDSDPDQRKRIEVTREEFTRIGQMGIQAVGLEAEATEEDATRTRLVVPIGDLATLATVAPIEEVLGNAEPVAPPRRQSNGERRSHNRTASGEPLVNYSDPQFAGLPHNGKIGQKEQAYVQANLELVNQQRVEAGHPAIDPNDPIDAERYGISSQAHEPIAEERPAPEQPPASDQETSPPPDQPSTEQESATEQQPARRGRRSRQQ
jgi:hypothetical protein